MNQPFDNAERRRHYGLRVGDIVELLFCNTTPVVGEVLDLCVLDNNAVIIKDTKDGQKLHCVAEYCKIITKVEDRRLELYLQELGKRILAARKEKKFSQHKLSSLAGLDRAYISSLECGKQNVTVGAIMKLANALEVSAETLITGY